MIFKRQSVVRDAAGRFGKPLLVLEDEELSVSQKINVLENWKLDLLELQQASEENMPAPEPSAGEAGETLRQVKAALATLRRELGERVLASGR